MRNQRQSSAPILSPPVLIVLIPIAAFVFLFMAVPQVVSFASNVFRPLAFRNGWDILNIILVLFAVLCGVFANRSDDEPDATTASDASSTEAVRAVAVAVGGTESGSDSPQRWFGYTEGYPGFRTEENTGVRRLRRTSSSYPDLRHDSLWSDRDEKQMNQVRFFDDFEVHKHRQTTPFHSLPRRHRNPPEEEAKVIPVDSFLPRTATVDETPPQGPPPPPPPPSEHRKPRRSYQAAGRREKRAEKHGGGIESEAKVVLSPPTPTPPPPPPRPPPSPARIRTEPKKLERRKSNVKKEIATALASLYNQRKRKRKQRITTITSGASSGNDIDSAAQSPTVQQQYSGFPPPPHPPPLPPPRPSSVFISLFKKGTSKTKRIHSAPPPPPPLPPTPPSKYETRSKLSPLASPTPPPPRSRQKPPLPAKPKSYDDNASSGGQSPLIPIPPPPPPPFKVAEWRFDVRGDFVRILSAQSSRCGSPELDDGDSSSAKVGPEVVNAMDGGDGARAGLVVCPSPDVNLKADNFIARRHDGWRLEKIKSLREV